MHHGQVKGVFFVAENVGGANELSGLRALFGQLERSCLIAIDHEGGAVQRLRENHGAFRLPRPIQVGMSNLGYQQIVSIYHRGGQDLRRWGFNLNFGPVVDVHHTQNQVIGRYGRSFGVNPDVISKNAAAFIDGFGASGVLCCLKHFPGHGRSKGDSHYQPADISSTWTAVEMEPFRQLIESGHAQMVMSGHLSLKSQEQETFPATLSPWIIQDLLKNHLGFPGVTITDDLDMDAISSCYSRRQAVIQALRAGNDILMIKNLYKYDPLLPKRVLSWVRSAIKSGDLQESRVIDAAQRVIKLKARLATAPVPVE
jgi:beta-N-acetylhexosaminidase